MSYDEYVNMQTWNGVSVMAMHSPIASSIAAKLHRRAGDGPMRLTQRGRRHRATGWYMSVKMGAAMPWESRNELHALWRAEVDTNVLSYRVQPRTFEGVVDGVLRQYTPDRMDWLADGRVEVVEVKNCFDAEAEPAYSRKLEAAREVFLARGWAFRIQERSEIEAAPSFEAIRLIQQYRRTALFPDQIIPVQQALTACDYITMREGCQLVGGGENAPFVLYAMMVKRLVSIDLKEGISDRTRLRRT